MGFVMFISINDFFKDFVRDNYDLVKGSELLIISRDIVANGDSVESELPFEDATSTSRYESITFVPDLVPNASVMEYSHGSTRDMFYKAYMEQLSTKSSSKYLCCIVDTVVNDDSKIFLICSQTEYLLEYMEVLKDYMQRAKAFVFAAEEDFGIIPMSISRQIIIVYLILEIKKRLRNIFRFS